MTRPQIYSTTAFIALFLLLLFGFRTKPSSLLREEKTRMLNLQATDISILKNEAFGTIEGPDKARIQILESRLAEASDSTQKIQVLEELSSEWFRLGKYSMAGFYAEEIAGITSDAASWGIAGTTYALGAARSTMDKEKKYNRDKSLEMLEMAISEDPQNLEYQINRAVVLAEQPDSDNPMKGIQLLLALNKNYPENVPVMNNLARFAIRTNQLDRALERLNYALALEPDNSQTHCLLAELYEKMGDTDTAAGFRIKCDN